MEGFWQLVGWASAHQCTDWTTTGGLKPALRGRLGGHPRERQILVVVVVVVAGGAYSAAVGEQLHLSPKTVDTYRSRLMAKLDLADLPALVRRAIRAGLVGLDER